MLCSVASYSQIIFQEDFDGVGGPTSGGAGTYKFPDGWFLRNVDNRTPDGGVAYVNEAWERREDFVTNVLDSTAFSTSWYVPAGQADDWMWTPLIGPLPPNCLLKWKAIAYDPQYQDGYEVRVMTQAGGPPTGGTGAIGNQITNSTLALSIPAENSTWTDRQLSLSAYAGQSVYIGFRNNSIDKFLLLIDDVVVEAVTNFDANLTAYVIPSNYSNIPLNQVSPISFKGTIRNDGSSSLSNVILNAKVYDESDMQLYATSSSPLATLAPDASANFTTIGSYLPSITGKFRIEYSATMTEVDEMPLNNTQTDSITISDSTFSRSIEPVTGFIGIGAGNGGYMGNQFAIANNGILTSASISVASSSQGSKLGMAVFDYANGKPSTLLYQSSDSLITNIAANVYTFSLPNGGLAVSANDTIVVTAVEIDSTLALAQTNNIFTPGTSWVNWPTNPNGGWSNIEIFGSNLAKPFSINANFGFDCDTIPIVTPSILTQQVCNGGSSTAITFISDQPNTTFNWTNDQPSIGLAANGTGDIASFTALNMGTTPITANITVTPVIDEVCAGDPVVVTIIINPSQSLNATPLMQSICSGESIEDIIIDLVPAGGFNWTRDNVAEVTGIAASGTGNISGTLMNTIPGTTTVNFTISATGGQCNGIPVIASVEVSSISTVDTIIDQVYCVGNFVDSLVITGSNPEATYTWSNDNPAIGLGASGIGNIPQFTATNSQSTPITANITVTPSGSAGGNSLVPEILYYKFNESGPSVTNYASNPPSGAATATIMGSLSITESDLCENALTGSGNPSSTDYLNTGWATNLPGDFTISFKSSKIIPSATLFYIFSDDNIGSFRCFTNGVAGPNNWMLRGTGIADVYVNGGATVAPHTTTFVYDATAANIKGYLDGVLVTTVNQGLPIINGTSQFKLMGYPSSVGAPLGGQLDDYRLYSRALTAEEVATLSGCLTEGCGVEPRTYSITVNPEVDVTVSPIIQSVCSNNEISAIITTADGSGYASTWTRDNTTNVTGIASNGSGDITGTPVNTTLTDQIVVFTITTTDGICSYTNTASITVNPQFETDQVSNIVVCNGSAVSDITLSGTDPEATYSWTNDNTSIGLGASGDGNIPSFNAFNNTNAPVVSTITVTSMSEGGGEGETITENFLSTGEIQTFEVPAGVTSIYIEANGAKGSNAQSGAGAGLGASGGKASGNLAVAPGQIINIYVGGSGNGSSGGFNGGGAGGSAIGGGGGGASDVRIGGIDLSDRVLVAGGGGGGGGVGCEATYNGGNGGEGGGLAGMNGTNSSDGGGGAGGTLGNGGNAGIGCGGFLGQPGNVPNGGDGQECCCFGAPSLPAGGGGGGGFNQGGGGGGGSGGTVGCIGNNKGGGGGGAGGSSHIGGVSSGIVTDGTNNGDGFISISYNISEEELCSTQPITFTITVNPTPSYTFTSDGISYSEGDTITACNQQVLEIEITSPDATDYTFTRLSNGNVIESGSTPASFDYTATNAREGYYEIGIESSFGCIVKDTIYLLVNPTPNPTATATPNPICQGSDLQLGVNGNNNFDFAWSGPNGYTSNEKNPVISGILPSASGIYTVTVTNLNGCSDTSSVNVLVNPTPTYTFTSDGIAYSESDTITACNQDILDLVITSPTAVDYTFTRLSNGNVISSGTAPGAFNHTANNAREGYYEIAVFSSFECILKDTIYLLVNPLPNPTATATPNPICQGGNLQLGVNGNNNFDFAWSGPNGYTSNVKNPTIIGITPAGSGAYTVTVTNLNGCSDTSSVSVLVNPTPTAVAAPAAQTICSGSAITTIVITGAVSGTTYNWTRNNTATVTGIAVSGSGNISGLLTNTTLSPVTVTFTITPTANGCVGTSITATVIVNPTLILTVTPTTQTICSGSLITTIVPGGGIQGSVYNWTRDNTISVTGIAASGSGNVNGILTNTTLVPVTVTFTFTSNPYGCAATSISATVIVNPTPIGTISIAPNPACVGSTVQLSSTGGTTYNWSGPNGFTSNQQNPTILIINHLQAGKYYVTITNSFGCFVILDDELEVFYPPLAEASFDVSTACTGSDLQLYGSGAGSYAWSGPNGFTSTLQNPVIEDVTTLNSGLYILTVNSPNGCTATSSLNITINTPPQLSANPAFTQTCEGSSVQLTGSGSGAFSWSGPAGWLSNMQNPVIDNIPLYMSGLFTVTLTGNTGCSSTASVEIKVSSYINAIATATPNPVCEGQSLQLHAEGGTSYLWNGPAGFNSTESDPRIDNIIEAQEGIYYVYITNEGGCYGYAEVKVEVLPVPKASAYATPNPVNEFSSVQFFASNGLAYLWSGPQGFISTEQNPVIRKVNRNMAGVYTVTITNENGCPSVIKIILRVLFTNKGGSITDGNDELSIRTDNAGTVYPNPTNNLLYFETASRSAIDYMIYDMNGKLQMQQQSTTNIYIKTENLSTGIYQIRWKPQDQEKWIVSKFVKIR